MRWQWHQLDYIQIICTLHQTDNHSRTSPLRFYRADALPVAQPTVSKHNKENDEDATLLVQLGSCKVLTSRHMSISKGSFSRPQLFKMMTFKMREGTECSWKLAWLIIIISGQSNLTWGCITATHGRLSRIRQVAPMCTPYIEIQKW